MLAGKLKAEIEKHRTLNIEHPTSYGLSIFSFDVQSSALDARCFRTVRARRPVPTNGTTAPCHQPTTNQPPPPKLDQSLTVTLRGFTASDFGNRTVSRPWLIFASIFEV